MAKYLALCFFFFLGISVASGRIRFDPKTWYQNVTIEAPPPPPPIEYCKLSIREIGQFLKECDFEDFMDVDIVCPLPKKNKKFLWFW